MIYLFKKIILFNYFIFQLILLFYNNINFEFYWGLGIGDWGLGPIPNPQSPIPNPQSPIPNPQKFYKFKE